MRENLKKMLGKAVSVAHPQCRFEKCLLIFGHMRSGSTALANILTSRKEISGYGETHINYDGRGALGRLVVNQALRKAWEPRAPYLLDKVLHNRYDIECPEELYDSKGIFIVRKPKQSVVSISKLFQGLGKDIYNTDEKAIRYYIRRLDRLMDLWKSFPEDRRVGLSHSELVADPDAALEQISTMLEINPPLTNTYSSHSASVVGGGGDPVASWKHNKIVKQSARDAKPVRPLEAPPALQELAQEKFEMITEEFSASS